MTKEQRQAIKSLDGFANTKYGAFTAKEGQTILSLIEEQQEEINDLKEIKEIADMEVTELIKIKEVNKLKSDNWILQVKNERKDKIIYKMAEFMNKTGTGRKLLSCMFRQNDECNENGCTYCIKQYFEDKVNSSEQN